MWLHRCNAGHRQRRCERQYAGDVAIRTVPVDEAQAQESQRESLENAGVRVTVNAKVLKRALAQSAKARRRA
jgi:hypothetical protein